MDVTTVVSKYNNYEEKEYSLLPCWWSFLSLPPSLDLLFCKRKKQK